MLTNTGATSWSRRRKIAVKHDLDDGIFMRDVILTYRLTKYYGRMLADKPLDRDIICKMLGD